MRYIYSILFYLATPFIVLRLYWRGRHNPGYRKRWTERFGMIQPPESAKHGIWIHAVSLGEAIAATPLINHILRDLPCPVTVSTTTPTGSVKVQQLYGDKIFHCYFPYDLPGVLNRFLSRLQPKLLVVMETELWPNLSHACKARDIPIVLANARLSEHSFNGYRKFPQSMRDLLSATAIIAAQTKADQTRFIQLGAAEKNVPVLGSIKFDVNIPASTFEKGTAIKQLWDNSRTAFIVASTHEGEEEIILEAYALLKPKLPNLLLVLVPRHPDRFDKIAQMCERRGYDVVRRSAQTPCPANTDIFLGDTMGELTAFYAACDIALVAGSLMPIGGHNMLESAACGLPSLTGPHVFNQLAIYELLHQAGVVFTVNNAEEIAQTVIELSNDASKREKIAEKAIAVVAQNRGACEAHFQHIKALLPEKS